MCTTILSKVKKFIKSIRRGKTLQAHSSITQFKFPFSYALKGIKRVSLRLSVKIKASISIEASIAIPIFLLCFLEIISLLNYLSVYSGVLYTLKSAAEPIAMYSYAYEELVETDRDISIGESLVTSLVFSEAYLDAQIRKRCNGNLYANTIKGGAEGIHVLGSRINREEGCVDVIAYYTVKPIVSFAGTEMFMQNRYYTKLWTGYSEERIAVPEEYVYVTENRSVYHTSEACTHLRLSISRVKPQEVDALRNSSGARYTECEKCCEENQQVSVYYIAKQGDKYHEAIDCPGLKRTIYCVKKEDVEGIPMCRRCGQKEGD